MCFLSLTLLLFHSFLPSFFAFFLFFTSFFLSVVLGIELRTQVLVLARQAFYLLSPAPCHSSVMFEIGFLFVFCPTQTVPPIYASHIAGMTGTNFLPGLSLNCNPPDLYLLIN
jgi:hypothetical protein